MDTVRRIAETEDERAVTVASKHSPSRAVHAGDWRLVMQGRTRGFDEAAASMTPRQMTDHPAACLGVAFYLAKRGETATSRNLIDRFAAAGKRGRIPGFDKIETDLVLVDMHIKIYEDRPMGQAEEILLKDTVQRLPASDQLGRALAMNHLCTVALHQGEFNRSQGYAENAMRAYLDGGAAYGALHLHAHLGQIRLARGDLLGAEQEYRTMEEKLGALRSAPPGLMSVCRALRSEAAYEMNDIETSKALLKDALASVEGEDAWLDVLASAYRVSTRLAFVESGLPGALSALARAERMATDRGMPRLQRLLQVERIRALTLSDEIDLARDEIDRAGLDHLTRVLDWDDEADWALRHGSTAVALARFLVRSGRPVQALAVLESAENRAIRGGQMLPVAKLRVIRAAALWRLRKRRDGVNALLGAIRLLGRQPFCRFILDEGPEFQSIVQAALDGTYAETRSNPLLRNRLSELSHHWAVGTHAAVSRHRHAHEPAQELSYANRYLQLVAAGLSNKEIARTFGVSTNTVKYHLKNIFRDLHVDSRTRAIQRGRELGII